MDRGRGGGRIGERENTQRNRHGSERNREIQREVSNGEKSYYMVQDVEEKKGKTHR